ncbi:MAG: ParB/RepB/Spo0J family partition protein [Mycolicibacterium frederiksbergense]|uniref:ParB/RepB/Spo0J family partition protein n=1 Tax=Mycobacteriaceae TaxID=1762 RepID=UPI0023F9C23E|nr:ParB/RepB/Spo0J family partition protein [Mycolicibacterium obuense]MBX9920470.1 ParB/RepB/Spo0J family partition protein [Mycolicibacterium frederiksbergense]
MAKGGVKGFGDLVGTVGDDSPVDGRSQPAATAARSSLSRTVALDELSGNPYNPRDSVGSLDELASIADFQLQPVVAVTRPAFCKLYPEAEIATKWVVILGNRRLAAAHKFGRSALDIVVRDELAKDRSTLLAAAIAENVDRSGFDVIEEAKAVDSLVRELGSADAAAAQLRKSKTWVSQRRALLKLAPDLQEATRRGDIAIREARALAQVPLEEQVARWNAARDRSGSETPTKPGEGSPPKPERRDGAPGVRLVTRALRRFDHEPDALAGALHEHLGPDGAKDLFTRLGQLIQP